MTMALALQTALTGMSAAETAISVLANNMANAQTDGFKASKPDFVTQTPQTFGLGVEPSGSNGGVNPIQIGRGVAVSNISTDNTPGPLGLNDAELSNTDLAHSLVDLQTFSNTYRANLQVIDTSSDLLDELIQLNRP